MSVDTHGIMELQQKTPDYYGNINAELARAVYRLAPSDVLEIGCGSGAMGAMFKRLNPGVRWDGIEFFPGAAKQASTVLDSVTEAAVEDIDLDSMAATYDTIVLGDVLEHLVNPWEVLKSLARILKRRGHICMSVPNVNHWSIFEQLGQGRFTYTDSGLLDRTHLRFFTRAELVESLQESGLKVARLESIVIPNPKMEEFISQFEKFQKSVGARNPTLAVEMRTFQWVITARK